MATVNKPTKESPDASGKKPSKKGENGSSIEQLAAYLKGVRSEWDKVTWPTWPQIWGQTIVVLVMVSIMTLGLYILDSVFHYVITAITSYRT